VTSTSQTDRRWLLAGGVLALAVVAAAALGWRQQVRERERTARFDRGEIALRVVAPPSATVSLYRAGKDLDTLARVGPVEGERWLAPANHLVEVKRDDATFWYPVPLVGQMRGPDLQGAFTVASRTVVKVVPPTVGGDPSRFVFIPSGTLALGDTKNPGESHFVYVTAFFIDAFEVTNAEFRRFRESSRGYERRESWTDAGWAWKQASGTTVASRLALAEAVDPRFNGADQPVVLVNWHEAQAYARWLTSELGNAQWVFRLPTEAEWEKAARGPDAFDYGLGSTLSEPEAPLYNWRKNPGAEVTTVGIAESRQRFRANRFGVYHASGNVAEWLQSVSRPFNRSRPYADDDRNDDAAVGLRTTRGGSWYSATATRLHLAYRESFQPELRSNDLGFRLVALPLPGGPARSTSASAPSR
jgi:formylglycine-generating enzyme required for sulfatase activity